MKQSQTKSKERVREHGEVFTAEREVKAMCDLVKDECARIDSRFLEPASGDGNFLAEILKRKLNTVAKKYKSSPADYEKNAFLAATSIYGVDILADNVLSCRVRMFEIWDKQYRLYCKNYCNDLTREAVKFIFQKNIVCGNALSLKCVDDKGEDTAQPIIFCEWSFVSGSLIKRRDFRFDVLLRENADPQMYGNLMPLFGDADGSEYWMIDPITKDPIPKPIKEFPPIYYRRVQQYD